MPHLKVIIYGSTHLTEKGFLLPELIRHLERVKGIDYEIKAEVHKKVGQNVVKNFFVDALKHPRGVFIFYLGEHNIRDVDYIRWGYLHTVEAIFRVVKFMDFKGLIIWNTPTPNSRRATYTDELFYQITKLRKILEKHPRVEVVNLSAQLDRVNKTMLLPDGIHLNEFGAFKMAAMLTAEIKVGKVMLGNGIAGTYFKLFDDYLGHKRGDEFINMAEKGRSGSPYHEVETPEQARKTSSFLNAGFPPKKIDKYYSMDHKNRNKVWAEQLQMWGKENGCKQLHGLDGSHYDKSVPYELLLHGCYPKTAPVTRGTREQFECLKNYLTFPDDYPEIDIFVPTIKDLEKWSHKFKLENLLKKVTL